MSMQNDLSSAAVGSLSKREPAGEEMAGMEEGKLSWELTELRE